MPENKDKLATTCIPCLAIRFSAYLKVTFITWRTPSSMLLAVATEEGKKRTENSELCSYPQRIGNMTTIYGTARFPLLTRLAKCLFSLPHSNAECSVLWER